MHLCFFYCIPHSVPTCAQLYVMLSAKMASRRSLASGIYYVTVLREPTRRFLSEFYEVSSVTKPGATSFAAPRSLTVMRLQLLSDIRRMGSEVQHSSTRDLAMQQ